MFDEPLGSLFVFPGVGIFIVFVGLWYLALFEEANSRNS